MTRLTKKGVTPTDAIQTSTDIANLYHVYNKLSKLEDIEEELGVDLIKLLTADEIYYKAHGEIESNIFDVSFYSFLILVRVYHSPYRKDDEHFAFGFNDYGKTWAFTKEELKNEKEN